jgi:hypothetical protein
MIAIGAAFVAGLIVGIIVGAAFVIWWFWYREA